MLQAGRQDVWAAETALVAAIQQRQQALGQLVRPHPAAEASPPHPCEQAREAVPRRTPLPGSLPSHGAGQEDEPAQLCSMQGGTLVEGQESQPLDFLTGHAPTAGTPSPPDPLEAHPPCPAIPASTPATTTTAAAASAATCAPTTAFPRGALRLYHISPALETEDDDDFGSLSPGPETAAAHAAASTAARRSGAAASWGGKWSALSGSMSNAELSTVNSLGGCTWGADVPRSRPGHGGSNLRRRTGTPQGQDEGAKGRRRAGTGPPASPRDLPTDEDDDEPHVGSFDSRLHSKGQLRDRTNRDGGSTGTGAVGGRGPPGAACSREVVERYGTLLLSSAGWRCTEMYDIHDSLLLANLSARRGLESRSGTLASAAADGDGSLGRATGTRGGGGGGEAGGGGISSGAWRKHFSMCSSGSLLTLAAPPQPLPAPPQSVPLSYLLANATTAGPRDCRRGDMAGGSVSEAPPPGVEVTAVESDDENGGDSAACEADDREGGVSSKAADVQWAATDAARVGGNPDGVWRLSLTSGPCVHPSPLGNRPRLSVDGGISCHSRRMPRRRRSDAQSPWFKSPLGPLDGSPLAPGSPVRRRRSILGTMLMRPAIRLGSVDGDRASSGHATAAEQPVMSAKDFVRAALREARRQRQQELAAKRAGARGWDEQLRALGAYVTRAHAGASRASTTGARHGSTGRGGVAARGESGQAPDVQVDTGMAGPAATKSAEGALGNRMRTAVGRLWRLAQKGWKKGSGSAAGSSGPGVPAHPFSPSEDPDGGSDGDHDGDDEPFLSELRDLRLRELRQQQRLGLQVPGPPTCPDADSPAATPGSDAGPSADDPPSPGWPAMPGLLHGSGRTEAERLCGPGGSPQGAARGSPDSGDRKVLASPLQRSPPVCRQPHQPTGSEVGASLSLRHSRLSACGSLSALRDTSAWLQPASGVRPSVQRGAEVSRSMDSPGDAPALRSDGSPAPAQPSVAAAALAALECAGPFRHSGNSGPSTLRSAPNTYSSSSSSVGGSRLAGSLRPSPTMPGRGTRSTSLLAEHHELPEASPLNSSARAASDSQLDFRAGAAAAAGAAAIAAARNNSRGSAVILPPRPPRAPRATSRLAQCASPSTTGYKCGGGGDADGVKPGAPTSRSGSVTQVPFSSPSSRRSTGAVGSPGKGTGSQSGCPSRASLDERQLGGRAGSGSSRGGSARVGGRQGSTPSHLGAHGQFRGLWARRSTSSNSVDARAGGDLGSASGCGNGGQAQQAPRQGDCDDAVSRDSSVVGGRQGGRSRTASVAVSEVAGQGAELECESLRGSERGDKKSQLRRLLQHLLPPRGLSRRSESRSGASSVCTSLTSSFSNQRIESTSGSGAGGGAGGISAARAVAQGAGGASAWSAAQVGPLLGASAASVVVAGTSSLSCPIVPLMQTSLAASSASAGAASAGATAAGATRTDAARGERAAREEHLMRIAPLAAFVLSPPRNGAERRAR